MKKIFLVSILLGVIATFSTSAMAVDVKFSGEYYVAGMYQDKTTFKKDTASDGPSTAFYYQRLRLMTEIVVAPGIILKTRADIMERAWGANRSTPGTALDQLSAGTRAENENIVIDLAYLNYYSPIGIFSAGYIIDGNWGTTFADNSIPVGKVSWIFVNKGLVAGLQTGKNNGGEMSYSAINSSTASDRDSSFYTAFVKYSFKNGEAGFLAKYIRMAGNRSVIPPDNGYLTGGVALIPYAKFTVGPLFVQAEVDYAWGQAAKWEGSTAPYNRLNDTRLEQWAGWLDATANFSKAYVGGTIAYVQGDDPGTGTAESGVLTGGMDWNPCLIMFNSDRSYWAGSIAGYGASANAGAMTNAWFFQVRGGLKPIDKLDIMASVSYANADKKPTANWLYNDYGWEVDLTATYKITNNLSYMLGGAYLFTGKYFKGEGSSTSPCDLTNNYMLIHKLTLTF